MTLDYRQAHSQMEKNTRNKGIKKKTKRQKEKTTEQQKIAVIY